MDVTTVPHPMIAKHVNVYYIVLPCTATGLGEDLTNNAVLCAVYRLPPHKPHVPAIMPGTVLPDPVCTDEDRPQVRCTAVLYNGLVN